MLEIGYIMALDCLPAIGKSMITVHLVVPSKEQAQLYQKRFAEKQSQADPRVRFEWTDTASFI